MKMKQQTLNIVFSAVIVVLFGAVVYLLSNVSAENNNRETGATQNSAVLDKTFTSTALGLSFEYPSAHVVYSTKKISTDGSRAEVVPAKATDSEVRIGGFEGTILPDRGGVGNLMIAFVPGGRTELVAWASKTGIHILNNPTMVDISKVIVGGTQYEKYTYSESDGPGYATIAITRPGGTLVIVQRYTGPDPLFDEIMSSIKFTE